ncbi:MoxR family ATPase [soil metagenome]
MVEERDEEEASEKGKSGGSTEVALLEKAKAARGKLAAAVATRVVGQADVIDLMLVSLLARGHALLVGVPGLAKTLLVATLAEALDLEFGRVQFTPDLLPADITGTDVLHEEEDESGRSRRRVRFQPGPIFHNLILADEINRTPPKTQSALLEAMEERQVSVDGVSRPLPDPFLVAATMNPIEYEGTYMLPEAQLDRFLLKLTLDVPERDVEIAVLARHAAGFNPRDLDAAGVTAVLGAAQLHEAQAAVARVGASVDVLAYAVDLARATRQSPSVKLGVSPRGSTALLAAAKAWAWLNGFERITPDHVQAMVLPVFRHRIQLRPEAELEGVSVDSILRGVLSQVQVPI